MLSSRMSEDSPSVHSSQKKKFPANNHYSICPKWTKTLHSVTHPPSANGMNSSALAGSDLLRPIEKLTIT